MAPGPPDKQQSNRFAILGDYIDQRFQSNFPTLSQIKSNLSNDPKYIVISSEENKLKKLSPFVIYKGLHAISTLIDSISQLRDGKLLLLVRNQVIADKFLKAKTLLNICPINVKLHDTLNYVKGVIYAPCLADVSEEEIVKELRSQGVVSVYKYISKSNNINGNIDDTNGENNSKTGESYSGYMVLTFNLYNLPKAIDVAWYKVKVKMYFPNPMRCQKCQLLGHTKNKCNNPETCTTCNLPPHPQNQCTRIQCANCNEEHPASDRNCPRYLQQKEIIKIKTINKCSYNIAKREYEVNTTTKPSQNATHSYSQITKDSSINQPTKQIQKRPASSPNSNNNVSKKTPCSKSSTSSQSSDLETEIPCSSSSIKEKNIKNTTLPDNTLQNEQKQNKSTINKINYNQHSTSSTPINLDHETNKETEIPKKFKKKTDVSPGNKSSNVNSFSQGSSTPNSPLSSLTQDLISKNDYYLPNSAMDTNFDS